MCVLKLGTLLDYFKSLYDHQRIVLFTTADEAEELDYIVDVIVSPQPQCKTAETTATTALPVSVEKRNDHFYARNVHA